jgi:hypothetical protein
MYCGFFATAGSLYFAGAWNGQWILAVVGALATTFCFWRAYDFLPGVRRGFEGELGWRDTLWVGLLTFPVIALALYGIHKTVGDDRVLYRLAMLFAWRSVLYARNGHLWYRRLETEAAAAPSSFEESNAQPCPQSSSDSAEPLSVRP